jgi:hypothetical protein
MNFQTDKLVILNYASYCGGKFVINSLGLSNDAFFQHNFFVKEQIQGKFTPEDKLDYLLEQLQKMEGTWDDLNLGCLQMFEVPTDNMSAKSEFNKWAVEASFQQKYFFIVAHSNDQYKVIKGLWPNAKEIQFTNCQDFMKEVRPLSNPYQHHSVENPFYTWNARWYLDIEETVYHLRELYQILDLHDFNEDAIRQYYAAWLSKIEDLKNVYVR